MSIHVVFVCLGNICRSPMAEGIFQHLVQEAGLENKISSDSCGTSSYHVGDQPHRGTQRVLKKKKIRYEHRSRQLSDKDLATADYLIAMDGSNLDGIHKRGGTKAATALLLPYAAEAHVREVRDVPDPYYVGRFEDVYDLVESGCKGLLAHIREEHGI